MEIERSGGRGERAEEENGKERKEGKKEEK